MYNILFSRKFLIPTLSIAVLYIIIITYFMNFDLVWDTIIGNSSYTYKTNLLVALLKGMWNMMSSVSLVMLFATAFLTGANLTLLSLRLSFLRRAGSLHFVAGGSSLFGVVASGCVSCGLPTLALLGLSGAILYLPLRGLELTYIAVILLSVSLYFQIKNYDAVCRIRKK